MAFEAHSMMLAAERATGLSDWGEFDVRAPLEALTQSLETEADLNAHGLRFAEERIAQALCNRLRLVEDRKRYPEIARQAIERPIIIPGLPRTGTSILFNLLAQDPANRSPRTWEIMQPSPPPRRESYEEDARIEYVQRKLGEWGFLSPEMLSGHPFDARLAEECIFLCEPILSNTPFPAFWHVPAFAMRPVDLDAVFAEHRRFLQHLQAFYPGERWLLKAPTHLLMLDHVARAYPDAMFVLTHRDLAKVLPSIAALFVTHRKTFTDNPCNFDLHETMQFNLAMWSQALEALEDFRKRPGMEARFVDVRYLDIVADPVGVAEAVYGKLGLALSHDTAGRMRAYVGAHRGNAHGLHAYSLAQSGLTRADIEGAFGGYMDRYGIERED
ncbi:MAG: sulfotransferase [Hyphomonadaceae bacterium]